MAYDMRATTVRVAGPPVPFVLQSFPIACLTCALLTDVAYADTANMMWADFSAWLLAVGLGVGVLAAIVGLIGLLTHWRLRAGRVSGLYAMGSVIVLVLAGLNNLVHSRDAWTSVVPVGVALSAVTVLVMVVTFWMARRLAYRDSIVVNQVGTGI
jgi:uncharacterized membrane protein